MRISTAGVSTGSVVAAVGTAVGNRPRRTRTRCTNTAAYHIGPGAIVDTTDRIIIVGITSPQPIAVTILPTGCDSLLSTFGARICSLKNKSTSTIRKIGLSVTARLAGGITGSVTANIVGAIS